ncbi:MAG: FAD-dependent oxidoreductase [Trueperaceae bacterium]
MRTYPGRGHRYDLAVVGAGISGSEAALAAAVAGLDVLLVTTSLDTVYMLAHERAQLDAPAGTLMSTLTAQTVLEGERIERWPLHRKAKYALESQSRIHLLQSNVTGLIVQQGQVRGVRTWEGVERQARATALCAGSFLEARLEQGKLHEDSGRLGEMTYDELFEDLAGRQVSFDSLTLYLSEHGEGLPYTVSCKVLSANEMRGFEVDRLPGLYAAGVCAAGALDYEQAAAAGRDLGLALAQELAAASEAGSE